MGRKRKASLPWCYYCGREFEDERVLTLHQKAKHFKCGSCDRQWPNIGAMCGHALKAHGETVLKARTQAYVCATASSLLPAATRWRGVCALRVRAVRAAAARW